MPRTAARTQPVRQQPDQTHAEPRQPTRDDVPIPPHTDHAPDGRFVAGNRGGPGNPHARHCARMLALFRSCISDEEMVSIIRMLVDRASKGDASAAKLLLSYKIGKPAPAPNPDQVDRDEWEHYQKDTINLEEMQQVLSSLPARVGNDIARTALPIMTEARTRELAAQMRQGLPVSPEVETSNENVSETENNPPPLPIGNSDGANQPKSRSTERSRNETANGGSKSIARKKLNVRHAGDGAPIGNGNSRKSARKTRPKTSEKRRRAQT